MLVLRLAKPTKPVRPAEVNTVVENSLEGIRTAGADWNPANLRRLPKVALMENITQFPPDSQVTRRFLVRITSTLPP